METTLFWIGCGLGVYAYGLRHLFNRARFIARPFVSVLLHLLFMASVGMLVGFVYSASTELQGPTLRWPVTGALAGLVFGLLQWMWNWKKSKGIRELLAGDLEWAETSFSAILLASVIMYAVVQAFKIPSGSMENTLLIGDHLFVNKYIYGVRVPFTEKRILKWRDVQRGEIIVFEAPPEAILSREERRKKVRKDFIKRAIGLPGDQIEIRSKRVYVNGELQNEPYAALKDPHIFPAAKLEIPPVDYQRFWEEGRFDGLRREHIGDNFGPVKVPANSYFVMGDNRDGSFDSRFWGPLPNRLLKGKAWIVYWPIRRIKVIHSR